MLQPTDLLSDPELGSAAFTVVRTVYHRRDGTFVPLTTTRTAAVGCVHPEAPETLSLEPEEDKKETRLVIYTPFPLSTGRNDGITWQAADQILYDGFTWRVISVKDWSPFGFVKAVCVKIDIPTSP